MLGQGELAARGTQAIDDLDGHDVGGSDRVLARGHVTVDDRVEAEELPEPAGQPDIAEAAGVGPADLAQANADDIGIIGQRDLLVVGKEAELLGIALAVVEDDGALPAAFLVVVEFAEIGDDVLPRPGLGAHALDQGVVGVGLAFLGAGVAAQEHPCLLAADHGQEVRASSRGQVFTTSSRATFHYAKSRGIRAVGRRKAGKIDEIFVQVRKIG